MVPSFQGRVVPQAIAPCSRILVCLPASIYTHRVLQSSTTDRFDHGSSSRRLRIEAIGKAVYVFAMACFETRPPPSFSLAHPISANGKAFLLQISYDAEKASHLRGVVHRLTFRRSYWADRQRGRGGSGLGSTIKLLCDQAEKGTITMRLFSPGPK